MKNDDLFISKYRNSYTTSIKTRNNENKFISRYSSPKDSHVVISGTTRPKDLFFVSIINKK